MIGAQRLPFGAAPVRSHTRQARHGCCGLRRPLTTTCSATFVVDVEKGKVLLDRSGYKFLDIRSEADYDEEHMTKPPRTSYNVPFAARGAPEASGPRPSFVQDVVGKLPKSAGLIVVDSDGGDASRAAAELLSAEGYAEVAQLHGGYRAWTKVWSTGGRRRPPQGKWVSTGTEALKSGLNVGSAAASYEEGGNLARARYAAQVDANKQRDLS